jgi:Flp pilus assembly protein TadG
MARNRRGDNLIEFTLLGIPMLFVTVSLVTVSLDMWEFHELPYACEMTARYAATHGAGCAQNGNTCTITVANMVTFFEGSNISLNANSVNVTLTDGSGATNCNPLSSCASNNSQFPNASYNSTGSDVTVAATYILKNPIIMFWPPNDDPAHDFTVGATSRQRIIF